MKICFIGAGNMARGLISGLIANGWNNKQLWATCPHQEKLDALRSQFAIQISCDNKIGARAADIVVFAVKPQLIKTVAMETAEIIQTRHPLVISVAAGITESALQRWLSDNIAIVRCMPNMPSLIGCGATALHANPRVSNEQKAWAEAMLRAVGITVWLDNEQQLDIVTALSGSGPAYFLRIMEILEQAAIAQGLAPATAHALTLHTALGTAQLALASAEPLTNLRQYVTSPKGTTEQALKVLEAGNITKLFTDAIQAAQQRAAELAQSFEEQ